MSILTTREIASVVGKSVSTIQRVAKTQGWTPAGRTGLGGSLAYELSKLPLDIQIRYLENRPVSLVDPIEPEPVQPPKDRKQKTTDARFHVLSVLPDWLNDRANFAIAYNRGAVPVPDWVRKVVPWVTPRMLKDWQNRLVNGLVDASVDLAPRHSQRRANKTKIDADPQILEICLAFVTSRASRIEHELKTRLPHKSLPCRKTIENWQKKWQRNNPQEYSLLIDSSNNTFKSRYQSAIGSYSEEVYFANQLWEIDGTPEDILCKDGKRYTEIALVDVFSRRTKRFVAPNNSSESVALLLRSALLDWGVPQTIKFDLGKEYDNIHVRAVCSSLGIEQKFCTGYSPEQKPHIERLFKTVTENLFERLPGYCGHSVAERKRLGNVKGVLAPEELQQIINDWVAGYESRKHSTLGCSPLEQWAKSPTPTKHIQDERSLDVLLEKTFTRKVQKTGIRHENGDYFDELGTFIQWAGQKVFIRVDPDQGKLHCFHIETGEYLFTALNSQRLGISRKEAAARSRQRQKTIKAAAKAIKNLSKELSDPTIPEQATIKPFGRKQSFESAALAAAAEVVAANLPAEPPAPLTEKQELRRIQEQQKVEDAKAQKPQPQESPGQRFYRLLCDRNRGVALMPEDNGFVDRCLAKNQFPSLIRQAAKDTGGSPPARAN